MRAIQGANSMEELAEIVNKNMQRFKDESGKTLPIVKEFMTAARGTEKGEKVIVKKDDGLDPFRKLAKESKDVNEFMTGMYKIKNVSMEVSEAFREKYDPEHKLTPRETAKVFMDDIKGEKESKPETTTKPQPGIDKIRETYQKGKKVKGDEDTIYVGKEELSGQWKMVEAEMPSASHDEKTFNRTEGFPTNEDGSTINDRDYEKDKAAQEIVNSVASEFDGRALSFDSPVVVTQDGIVVSGNNRTMSSKIAARKGTDKKYIKALERRAKKFGFSPDDMKKFKNPRVVFEIDNKEAYSTERFARFNVKEIKAMSPIETAVKMSKLIKIDTIKGIGDRIQEFDSIAEMYADKKATTEIFNTLQRGKIITEFNRPQYITEDGVTAAGKEFLETVMVGSVVSEANIRALNKAKSVRKKLVKAISQLVQNKSMGGYSISKEINQAIDVVMQVRASGDKFKSVDDFAKQSDMFQEKNDVAVELAKKLELKEREFADFMQKMNANLGEGASGQTDIFFGEVESKEDVLSRMLNLKKALESFKTIVRKNMIILKARKMAIGTVSHGRKKIAEGKWVPVEKQKTIVKPSSEKERMEYTYHDKKYGEDIKIIFPKNSEYALIPSYGSGRAYSTHKTMEQMKSKIQRLYTDHLSFEVIDRKGKVHLASKEVV